MSFDSGDAFTIAGVPIARDAAVIEAGLDFALAPVASLQETYQDWRVACQVANDAKRCALSQQQTRQNGQRLLALELQVNADGAATGVLVLPFGLKLDAGVSLGVDDALPLPALRFSTYLPVGCLAPLAFDALAIAALRSGQEMKIMTIQNDGQELELSVSLKGFSAAFDRVGVLAR